MPRIIKSDERREPFDERKLRGSMLKSLEKRPVAGEAIDAAVVHICNKLRAMGEREVPSRLVGELVMEELHDLDEVAYVRFASVYRSFQDVDAFREEIDRMRHRRSKQEAENQLALWVASEGRKKK
jgi:transcriptional repressor NrdR